MNKKIVGGWRQYDWMWAEVEFFKDEKGFYFEVSNLHKKDTRIYNAHWYYKTKEECEEAALKFTKEFLKEQIDEIWSE